MKRKILIAILGLLIFSQLPFTYRRYRLSRLQKAIRQLESQRVPPTDSQYVDYQGVIHVHSFLGGHSTGTFAELIDAAKANQLDFVIMTEHPQADFDTSAMTLNGVHNGILFINGNEVATRDGDRLLLIPGSANAAAATSQSTNEVVDRQKSNGGLAFVAYPSESQSWSSTRVDGVEIYNLFTNARQYNSVVAFFDSIWSFRSYPDLMFANFYARPTENLKRWDEANAAGHKLVAIAGNDAHSNIGLSVNDSSGKQWLGVKLDSYERSFRVVRTHVLVEKDKSLTRESLLEAISKGHCYVSFDLLANGKGFSFAAANYPRIMGDGITYEGGMVFEVKAPLNCRLVLLKNREPIDHKSGSNAQFPVDGPGVYRVEAFLDQLPQPSQGALWIISNPIFVDVEDNPNNQKNPLK